MSLTLVEIANMTPDQVREFVRDVGIAHENNRAAEHSAWEIAMVVMLHGTAIAAAMSRAFMAQPELRQKRRRSGARAP